MCVQCICVFVYLCICVLCICVFLWWQRFNLRTCLVSTILPSPLCTNHPWIFFHNLFFSAVFLSFWFWFWSRLIWPGNHSDCDFWPILSLQRQPKTNHRVFSFSNWLRFLIYERLLIIVCFSWTIFSWSLICIEQKVGIWTESEKNSCHWISSFYRVQLLG